MTPEVMYFVEAALAGVTPGAVLEFGARNVNGSPRQLVERILGPVPYTGVDLEEGPGVDLVADMTQDFSRRASIVLCLETLEHIQNWRAAVNTLKQACDGVLIVTVPTAVVARHEYPGDFWRFTRKALGEIFYDGRVERLERWHDGVGIKVRPGFNLGAINLPVVT